MTSSYKQSSFTICTNKPICKGTFGYKIYGLMGVNWYDVSYSTFLKYSGFKKQYPLLVNIGKIQSSTPVWINWDSKETVNLHLHGQFCISCEQCNSTWPRVFFFPHHNIKLFVKFFFKFLLTRAWLWALPIIKLSVWWVENVSLLVSMYFLE